MMYADSSDRGSSGRNSPSTSKDEDETGNGDADSKAAYVIDKAWELLVEFMDPNPIFDCAIDSGFFKLQQIIEMQEEVITSKRNRNLINEIRRRGRRGYDKLKKWLGCTKQTQLIEMLEEIEYGKDYTKHLETLREKMKHKMKKAVPMWRDCLQMTDKPCQIETARGLLAKEILPGQAQVRLACSVFGRCSETFLNICSSISEDIKSKSDDIIDVWAAYRYNEHIKDDDIKPVFVVIKKKGKAGVSENDFDIIERDETVFSAESERVLVEVENDLFKCDDSELTDIEKCVSLNADSLMDKHKNLNIVSPSVKKSKKFETDDAQIYDELCIALYVHIKGLIPIAEEPFPSKIEKFRTDVLEGGFKLFHGGPYDYHKQLKMGLAIHANATNNNGERLFGTLGGFVDYPPNGMCALTCAHVVLSPNEMQQLVTRNRQDFREGEKEVFQSSKAFGHVLSAVYSSGDQHSSGVDVALIKIMQRHPKDGSFPAASNYAAAGFDDRQPMVYKKGKVSPVDGIRRRAEVYKYGISTGVTRGSLGLCASFVKTSGIYVDNQQNLYRLKNQIEVLRIGGSCFASHGDSGALVFFDDTENDSVAIGIVEGGHTNNHIVFVTPLRAILDNFGNNFSMTKFINDGSVSNDSG